MLVEATASSSLKFFKKGTSVVWIRADPRLRAALLPEMHPGCLCSLTGTGRLAGWQVGCSAAKEGDRSRVLSPHHRLTLFTSVENLDETREQKEKSPPDQSAVPNTPPSTPVKLEEGESCGEACGSRCEGLHGLCTGSGMWPHSTHVDEDVCISTEVWKPAVSPVPALTGQPEPT